MNHGQERRDASKSEGAMDKQFDFVIRSLKDCVGRAVIAKESEDSIEMLADSTSEPAKRRKPGPQRGPGPAHEENPGVGFALNHPELLEVHTQAIAARKPAVALLDALDGFQVPGRPVLGVSQEREAGLLEGLSGRPLDLSTLLAAELVGSSASTTRRTIRPTVRQETR